MTGLEQRVGALEAEVKELRAIFTDWQSRVGSQLDQMAIDALADTQPALPRRPGLDDSAIAAAQALVTLGGEAVAALLSNRSRQRHEPGDLGPRPEKLMAAADAIRSLPQLLALAQRPTLEPGQVAVPLERAELYRSLHRAANEWWDAYGSAEPDPVDGPDDTRAKQDQLACAEENLQDALAALRDAGVCP